MSDPGQDASGHRARLRARLIGGGPDALLDHELIEYLLALAIPRRDTKPLARQLLAAFGGLGPLLSADGESLARIGGLTEGSVAALKIAQAAALRLLKTEVAGKPVLGSWQALLDYLTADMAHRSTERVRVLYLNSKNMLIRDEAISEGSVDEAAVYVREIVRGAIDCGATALILVHNHPSGDPRPSAQDIRLTKDIVDAGRHLRLTVHDHVIVASTGHASMRAMGLL